MNHRQLSDSELLKIQINSARDSAYQSIVPLGISRKERRSAIGKMLIAQGEAAAMRAELEILRRENSIED